MYAGDDFTELASWCLQICDETAAGAGEEGRSRMREAFVESSRHELAFWDAAWHSGPDSTAGGPRVPVESRSREVTAGNDS